MSLLTGTRLGPYEVVGLLGAGGMGEVYRARDTKLGRDVALKVLPAALARDPERMARFEREARVLASLNHPNIAAIHGLEESNGVRALVMELVEGPTLADRLSTGAIPLEETLAIARQMAEALEYAHEKGIVHRDLKPANVKVTPEGVVKVLDFGLAKAVEGTAASGDPANSPTVTLAATRAGVVLGTAGYMSPEQARGQAADKRADIWAFGVVLYEMVTGKPLFDGETVGDTLAEVLQKELDLSAAPREVQPLLERCLERDRKKRLRDIGDAWMGGGEPVVIVPEGRRVLPWVMAGTLAVALIAALWAPWRATRPVEQPLMRLDLDLGPDALLGSPYTGATAILSSDGERLVFVAQGSDGKPRLYSRRLDEARATPLSGTEGASSPFFSPDGRWVGFFAEGKLKNISVEGGAAVTLCDAPSGRGGSWSEDGSILAALSAAGGLSRISSAGGTPQPATELNKDKGEGSHRWPQVLPGGKAVLFTAGPGGAFEEARIEVQSFETGQRKTLQRGGYYGRYLPSGHLVYMHGGTLFAAPMDLARLEVTGPASPVLEEVASNPGFGSAQFDYCRTGTFIYVRGKGTLETTSILWLDSTGKTQPLLAKPGMYLTPRFSPDGKRLALTVVEGGNWDIRVYDWQRDTMTRLTFAAGYDGSPVWTPDGKYIAYRSADGIYRIRADGGGKPQRLTESKNLQVPFSFSPDGKRLAFFELSPETGFDIWTLPIGGDPDNPQPGKAEVFLRTPFMEANPAFSPDGRWLAYASNESGTFEVYVRPFPGAGGKWQISSGGGLLPVWSQSGSELFYRTPDNRIMVVTYTAKGDSFAAGKPRLWSEKQFLDVGVFPNFDLAPDGKRFAVLAAAEEAGSQKAPTHVTFLLNFFDELRRRVPAGAK